MTRPGLRARRRVAAGGVALLGPAFVAAVAYVDPDNVAANLQAGARYGYLLLWVLVVATVAAAMVQYLSAKLGWPPGRPCRNWSAIVCPLRRGSPIGCRPRRWRWPRMSRRSSVARSRCTCCSDCRCWPAACWPDRYHWCCCSSRTAGASVRSSG